MKLLDVETDPKMRSTSRIVASWLPRPRPAHGFGCAVLEDHAVVVAEEGVADGGLHADARGAAGHDQGYPQGAEELIELGPENPLNRVL